MRRHHSNFLRTGVIRRTATNKVRSKRPLKLFLALSAVAALTATTLVQLNQPTPVEAAPLSNTALKWTPQSPPTTGAPANVTNNIWSSVTWSPELGKFAAVARSTSFPAIQDSRIIISPDGKTWTTYRSGPSSRAVFRSVAWSPQLGKFAAVACADSINCGPSFPSDLISTSTDGMTWTDQYMTNNSIADDWQSITWAPGPGLFVVVGGDFGSGSTDRVLTSPDGVTWTARAVPEANNWNEVVWSPDLNLLVAVASSGTNRVMTSPDGINWTARSAAAANAWQSVAWSPELDLFVAVSTDGTNRVMTSPDGINWTIRTAPEASTWQSIAWSAELGKFAAVADTGTNKLMTSTDGITWTPQPAASNNGWQSITWSPETDTYVAVAGSGTNTTKIMTGAMITATTSDATSVAQTSAVLNGNYQDPFPGANVYFRYRLAGSGDSWTATTPQAVSASGAFTASPTGLTPNTSYEFKAVVQWSADGGTQELEGGLLTFTTLDVDDDGDGSANGVENACPNGGDSNDDGTQDSTQTNVTCFVNPVTGKTAVLEADGACQNNTAVMKAESANAAQDASYDYPAGLMDFTTDCGTPGFTTTVKQYVYGAEASYVMRKFNPNTKVYTTIDSAAIATATIGGQTTAVATYSVTDGGELDMDGSADGIIIDPAGLALAAATAGSSPGGGSSGGSLADTGQSQKLVTLLALGLVTGGSALFLGKRYKYVTKVIK